MKIGYYRVSTPQQNPDRQIAALRAEKCDKIFGDKETGKSIRKRPNLEKAIDALGVGDVLIIAEWDRVTRSYLDGISIVTRAAERQALVKVLDRDYFDLTTEMGQALLGLLSAAASDEHKRILRRAEEGRTIAKEKGVKFGRKPKLTEHQKEVVFERLGNGDSARDIAKDMGVAHSTIVRLNG